MNIILLHISGVRLEDTTVAVCVCVFLRLSLFPVKPMREEHTVLLLGGAMATMRTPHSTSLSIDLHVYISISRSRSLAPSAPSRLTRAIDTHSQSTSVAAEDGSREANSHSVGLTSPLMYLSIACQSSMTDEYRIDIVAAICSVI